MHCDRISALHVVQGDPFQEPSGLQRRRLPIGAGRWRELVVLLLSVCPHRHVQTEHPGAGCAAFHPSPQRLGSGQEKGPCAVNCLMSSPSFLCGLLQIGPALGAYLLPCVDPLVEWLVCTGLQRMLRPAPIMLTDC